MYLDFSQYILYDLFDVSLRKSNDYLLLLIDVKVRKVMSETM